MQLMSNNKKLAESLIGVWWLLSRIDTAADGTLREEPSLGSDPLGILVYAPDRFAAQFMKRNRSEPSGAEATVTGQNNTVAVGGYDAYFGRYEIDQNTGEVIHRLEGALTPENVGIAVSRNLTVENDQLEIRLATTTMDGEPVTRTLTWKRIG